ncbi:MAG: sialate O-acetylesterase [Actinobacteria bacterium]|nr:sialate O-acetylesterase [Actinomycetota bacterium]
MYYKKYLEIVLIFTIILLILSPFVKSTKKINSINKPINKSEKKPDEYGIHHIIFTGQSLAGGEKGFPGLTTTQPFHNITLNVSSSPSFTPLVEGGQESPGSAMANSITSHTKNKDYQIELTINSIGGAGYKDLKKGTDAYSDILKYVKQSMKLAQKMEKKYHVSAIVVIHGETDVEKSSSEYESYLIEWQNDLEENIKFITKQENNIPFITDQLSSFTRTYSTSEVPIAQLKASEDFPEKFILVGPKYFLNYADDAHLTNKSYRMLGEYYGKVYKQVFIDKKSWKPLSPEEIKTNEKNIYIRFHVLKPPLVLDTKLVLKQKNYGFEFHEETDQPAEIKSVSIINPDTVKIELNKKPDGGNQRIRYAYTGIAKSKPGAQSLGSARGNLRDSDIGDSLHGNKLYNWSVHFDKPINENDHNNLLYSDFLLFLKFLVQ